ASFTCVCVRQAAIVVLPAQFKVTLEAAVTVNVALQVLGASHELVTVNVTVLAPPHLSGAPELLLVTDPRTQLPPDAVAVASHAVNALFTCVCVRQAAIVVLPAQFKVTLEA